MQPKQLRDYLAQMVDGDVRISAMIWGAPGIGKSSIVRQVAERDGFGFIDLRLSQLAPTDLRGLPVPRDGITTWATPEFLPREGAGVLFLDEINMAPPAMQGVAQQLILDRRVGSYAVPDEWFVWAAGNRKEDRASVFEMPAPLANRFIHLEVEPDIDDFRRYALLRDFDPHVVGFVAFRPDLLHRLMPGEPAWPSPRSWELASTLHRVGLDVEPAVGPSAGAEFYAYLDVVGNVPDLDGILAGKAKPEFPAEVSLSYATVVGLVARVRESEQVVNGLSWLVDAATPEWVQLFAADVFPKLRSLGIFPDAHGAILAQPRLKDFLADFAQLLAD